MTIEEYLIRKLSEEVAPAYAEKPEDATGEYLVVDLISNSVRNCLGEATIAVRSYADSLAEASDLNLLVRSYMDSFWTDPKVSRCKVSTEYPLNSIAMMQYRYQCIYDITHYFTED